MENNKRLNDCCCENICRGSSRTDLNLWDESLKLTDVIHLVAAMQNENCKLTRLNLSRNNLGPEGMKIMVSALKNKKCKFD